MLSTIAHKVSAEQAKKFRFPPPAEPGKILAFCAAQNSLIQDKLEDYIQNKLPPIPYSALTYASNANTNTSPDLRKAVAQHVNRHFNPVTPVNSSDVLVTASATAVHEACAFLLAEPGDVVLVSRPEYGRFELDFGLRANVDIEYTDNSLSEKVEPTIVDRFEEKLAELKDKQRRVRAILISNPNNPTAFCYPKETIEGLFRLCQRHRIHLISDEIYALSKFTSSSDAGHQFTSALSIDPQLLDPDLLHVEYGMAKDFGSAGLKLGFLITRNAELIKAVTLLTRFHSAAGPSAFIAASILEDEEFVDSFFKRNESELNQSYNLTVSFLDRMGVEHAAGGTTGLFVYINLAAYLPPAEDGQNKRERECELSSRLFEQAGVFLQPDEEKCNSPGWYRLVFSASRDILTEGLKRPVQFISASLQVRLVMPSDARVAKLNGPPQSPPH